MASLIDLTKSNISYYTVPAALILLYMPHMYSNLLAGKAYDLANPRNIEQTIAKDESVPKTTRQRFTRARAAATNGLETIGVYAAAVVAANASGVETRSLNLLTLGYVASRVVFNYVYVIAQDNRGAAPVRSVAWMTGIGIIVTLFVKAGNAAK